MGLQACCVKTALQHGLAVEKKIVLVLKVR
jgi:hypothetical protein